MENFDFSLSVQILFGKDRIEELASAIAPYGKKVLLTYGGGSIKRMGLYDKVKSLLADCAVYELSGIAPNPKVDSVREGVKLCREHGIEVILAVGGGSVIDCSKAIAAAVYYEGDAWEMIAEGKPIDRALPIITVLTLSATGSEADAGQSSPTLKPTKSCRSMRPCLCKSIHYGPDLHVHRAGKPDGSGVCGYYVAPHGAVLCPRKHLYERFACGSRHEDDHQIRARGGKGAR